MEQTTTQDRTPQASATRKPSGKQIYRVCGDLCRLAGIPFPQTAAEASELIQRLAAERAAVEARRAESAGEPVPF